ncbi:cysteine desulfurase [Thalassotalea sp. 1_MG-2023]|uniref:aminotransferase class V-fold PLP-dependent enzyme n=1 Tax=Thalassotalea sp. 1_MG-2023 TaxID=3062680 RepID=UPI0026E1EE43|nr:cysteine desulfurase [Thalassotalea sp. 1_MG-2023]MDO6426386.1 cysteine desulfurase [Thalassotalea sp. 1_MG-2023]
MSIVSPWKHDFPVYLSHAHPNLCYLDSAATCLTPKHVADAVFHYQCYAHANSHKGLYQLSASVTERVEHAREQVANFIGAHSGENISFNHGTTDAINLVAYSFVEPLLIEKQEGDQANIVISAAEHHANLLPWQRLAQQYNVELRIAPLNKDGTINQANLSALLDSDTIFLAITHCSNVLGLMNPVANICRIARNKGIPTLIDGAQAICKGAVDVSEIDCDFYVFSAHKIYGPTGCGVLYAKGSLFDSMRPYQLGGGVIESVNYQQSRFITGPLKFEPGSHNVAAIVGLIEAIDYMTDISWHDVNQYIDNLANYMHSELENLPFYQPLIKRGDSNEKEKISTLVSFQVKKVHCHDIASLLDNDGIAIRAGHHCAQPLHQTLGVNASIRASLGLYNDVSDIDKLVASLTTAHKMMSL